MSPLIGTSGADVLRAQSSVTFVWVPDPGDRSYTFPLDPYGNQYAYKKSTASGRMTFNGVSPSEPIFGNGKLGNSFEFQFTDGTRVSGQDLPFNGSVFWNQSRSGPSIQGLNYGYSATLTLDAARTVTLAGNATVLTTDPPSHAFVPTQNERGRWALLDNPEAAFVLGGAGNDTIYGGLGDDTLLGGAGDDVIHLGPGDATAFGGAGNDELFAGRGSQVVLGGAGNDTIHGGTWVDDVPSFPDYGPGRTGPGPKILDGGAGRDVIFVGSGTTTAFGGAGADTIYGGSGDQWLDGGAGADVLVGGFGHQVFVGGAGRDVFVLLNPGGMPAFDCSVDVQDFQPGTDMVRVETPSNLPVSDLRRYVNANSAGDAVIATHYDATMTLHGVRASDVLRNPARYITSVADLPEYTPDW